MTRLRFIGDGEACAVFGHVFPAGEWVDDPGLVDHEIERLIGNPTFETDAKPAKGKKAAALERKP